MGMGANTHTFLIPYKVVFAVFSLSPIGAIA